MKDEVWVDPIAGLELLDRLRDKLLRYRTPQQGKEAAELYQRLLCAESVTGEATDG